MTIELHIYLFKSFIIYLILCKSKFTYLFNFPFSISFYPLSIHVNLFISSCQSRSMAIFSNHLISISSNLSHQSTLIFFYPFVNLNSRLSFSISPFLSHTILHLSTSIFLYLLANLVDAYLSPIQIKSLSISHYLFLQQKKISRLLRYFMCHQRANSFFRYS